MSDRARQACALTVLAPIAAGREESVRGVLRELPTGAESPLARAPGTHFARWVVIPALVHQGSPQKPDALGLPYLLFTSNFDGPLEPYLDALCGPMGGTADAVWGTCVGWPGVDDPRSAKAYLRANRVETSLFVAGYPEARLPEVLGALELRERVTSFAISAQGLDAESLATAWQREFGGRRT